MPTCKCGKSVEDWRGARGHVQFSSGEHGEKGTVPDDWRALFEDDADPEPEPVEQDVEDAVEQETTDPTPADPDPVSDESEAPENNGRLRRLLTTPIDELLG